MLVKKTFRQKKGYPNTKYYFLICKCDFCKKKFEISYAKYKSLIKLNRKPGVEHCSRACYNKSRIYQYCSIKDCDYDPYNKKTKYDKINKGYCRKHYLAFKTHGDPLYQAPTYKCQRCKKEVLLAHKKLKISRSKDFINYCVDCYRPALREFIFTKLKNKCKCCGEKNQVFLDIDHIKGGGGEERRKIKGVEKYYKRILRNLKSYRILCKNCNWAMHKYKNCPHQKNN